MMHSRPDCQTRVKLQGAPIPEIRRCKLCREQKISSSNAGISGRRSSCATLWESLQEHPCRSWSNDEL